MSLDNVNAAADESFIFDPIARFEDEYTEEPKDKRNLLKTLELYE
jgi:hypothetical protein